jgi:chemotaxis methyl-accepting protein methylase
MNGGFLVIGIKENLPPSIDEKMLVINEAEKIYKK